MNDLDAWSSAPCLKAYLDDLARYMFKSLGSRNAVSVAAVVMLVERHYTIDICNTA